MKNNDDQNQSNSAKPDEGSKPQPARRKRLRRVLLYSLAALAFLFLVVFPLLLNFYADRIIGRTLSEIVRIESDGMYVLSFEKVGLNVFSRDISFEGVLLRPDSTLLQNDSINLIDVVIPELHLKGASWVRSFWKRELIVKKFSVKNPKVHYSGIVRHQYDSLKSEALLVDLNLHRSIEDYIDILTIDKFTLHKGSLVVDFDNKGIEERLEIHDFSVAVDQFRLDSLSHQEQNRLFFSDSLGLQLDDGRFYYQKGPLNIQFAHLDVSSASDEIHLKSASLTQQKDSLNVIDLKIPGLILKGFDPIAILETGIIHLDEISFTNPKAVLNLHHQPNAGNKLNSDSVAAWIYRALAKNFEKVEVGKIKFKNAGLLIPGKSISGLATFDLPDFDLTLIHFLLDSSTWQQRRDFMFFDDFLLISHGQSLSMESAGLDIDYRKLSLNTALSRIRLDGLTMKKVDGNPDDKFSVEVPELKILGRNFKQDFLDRTLNLQTVFINGADIDFQKLNSGSQKQIDIYNLYPKINNHLKYVQIDDLEFKVTKIKFLSGETIDSAVMAKGTIDVYFYDFRLDEKPESKERILYSSGIEFNGRGLDVRIPKSGHSLLIDQARMDTRTSELDFNQFKIDTLNGYPPDFPLHLQASSLQVFGLDYQNLYFRNGYFADSIMLENPAITMLLPDASKNSQQSWSENQQQFYLGKISIINGSADVFKEKDEDLIAEIGSFNLALNDLEPNTTGIGFSQIEGDFKDIDIPLRNFGLKAYVEQAEFSSGDSLLTANQISLIQMDTTVQENKTSFHFELPLLSVRHFPLLEIYEKNTISAGKILLDHPSVNISHANVKKTKPVSFIDFDPSVIKPLLLQHLSAINLDSVALTNGSLILEVKADSAFSNIYAEGVNLLVQDFELDVQTTMSQSNLMFASDIQIAVDSIIRLSKTNDKLTLENFDLTTSGQKLSIESINYLTRDEAVKGGDTRLKLGSLNTTGLDYYGLMIDKRILLDKIEIDRPDLMFIRKPLDKDSAQAVSQPLDLYDMIAGHFHEIQANDISLSDVKLKITNSGKARKGAYLFEQIDFRLKNILIDSTSRIFGNRFLYSDDLDFVIDQFHETSADSLYDFGAANIRYSSKDAILKIDSGFLQPNYSDSVFSALVGVQTDRLKFVFDSLKFTNFRIVDFLKNRNLHVDKAELDALKGDDFRSKLYPFPKNHYPKLPASALKSLDFKVRVDTFLVRNSSFKYREYRPPALQPGEIWFTGISLQGRNITNDSIKIAVDSMMRFNASARLMGEAGLGLNLEFNLKKNNDPFRANGVLNYFDMTSLNPILEHVAFVKVTKGYNEMLTFDFQADNDLAVGEMDFRYRKMHIRLIDKKTLQTRGFGESIASFIANTFVVRRNNPKLILFFRDGEIYFPRDKQKSFFNYLTKSALSGVRTTIRGGSEERREKRRKREMERQLRKEGKLNDEYMKELNQGK